MGSHLSEAGIKPFASDSHFSGTGGLHCGIRAVAADTRPPVALARDILLTGVPLDPAWVKTIELELK